MKLLPCLALKFCRRTWKVLMHTRVLKDNTEKWGLSIFFTKIRENELEIFPLSNFSIISSLHKTNCARLTMIEIVFLSLSLNKVSFQHFQILFDSTNGYNKILLMIISMMIVSAKYFIIFNQTNKQRDLIWMQHVYMWKQNLYHRHTL